MTTTMTTYDSIEGDALAESERDGRRSWTFTTTQLLVACVAVCACTLASVTVVRNHQWRTLSESDADRARSHADYVYLHDQLTKCGEKLANAGASDRARSHENYVYLHDQLTKCGEKLAKCEREQ